MTIRTPDELAAYVTQKIHEDATMSVADKEMAIAAVTLVHQVTLALPRIADALERIAGNSTQRGQIEQIADVLRDK